jgi:hypothetical protein
MKKNIVTLDLEEYNEMRDFNEAIMNNNSVRFYYNWASVRETIIYTKDEALKEVAESNAKLKLALDELESADKNNQIFDKFKKMSLWQFINWKRKNR